MSDLTTRPVMASPIPQARGAVGTIQLQLIPMVSGQIQVALHQEGIPGGWTQVIKVLSAGIQLAVEQHEHETKRLVVPANGVAIPR